MTRKLTEGECRTAMEHGEFDAQIRQASSMTAIILTQSWCPQWAAVKSYLPQVEKAAGDAGLPEPALFYVEYDTESWFEQFMTFKENTFNNREVPYVRYYRNGKFFRDSNFISLQGFLNRLGIED
ncbi:hypothetical protein LJC14_04995 [Treponema sp. OttesenSCG-928-L16]|nr:hypothetical protein [Treponema sp. OttesenSCG-928-L16]